MRLTTIPFAVMVARIEVPLNARFNDALDGFDQMQQLNGIRAIGCNAVKAALNLFKVAHPTDFHQSRPGGQHKIDTPARRLFGRAQSRMVEMI